MDWLQKAGYELTGLHFINNASFNAACENLKGYTSLAVEIVISGVSLSPLLICIFHSLLLECMYQNGICI